ncbi:MAG: hypothetical protein JWO71_3564 [Candidatus Acidoferrum typicum]|nr:hypothetical protein [Candidatus Acidoferrum typicum]
MNRRRCYADSWRKEIAPIRTRSSGRNIRGETFFDGTTSYLLGRNQAPSLILGVYSRQASGKQDHHEHYPRQGAAVRNSCYLCG